VRKKPLGRPSPRRENNIKNRSPGNRIWGVKWVDLARHRDRLNAVENGVMKFPIP